MKGDGKMTDKTKKDADTARSNQTTRNFGWALLIVTLIFSVLGNYSYDGSNTILQFIIAAAPWVMVGVGVACTAASV